MLRGSFFNTMDDDPFFAAHHHHHMQRMNDVFNDFPFASHRRNMLGITDGHHNQGRQSHGNNQLQPFGMFDNMFGSMFKNMRNMMADMQRGFDDVSTNQNGPCYSQQSFVSYTKSGNEPPKVFQSSSSTRSGPNGVRETHKTVRDSESGVEKMAIGRHIYDRGHVMERSRNRRTGQAEENQNFINIDEEECPSFEEEFREKASRGPRGSEHKPRPQRSRIPIRSPHQSSSRLALPSPVQNEAPSRSPRRHTESRHVERTRYPESTRRVGFESRRADRRRATPRNLRDRN